MTKGRLEAFSDGVIAIIITITILIIDLPEGNDMAALMGVMPLAICYLISFIMVGTNWANHHHLLQVTGSVDGKILWSNLLYLFLLSFQPVTTGWVGKSKFAMLPVRVYVLMNLLCALSYILLEKAIIHSNDCEILKTAVSESRKEQWTVGVEALALILSFIPARTTPPARCWWWPWRRGLSRTCGWSGCLKKPGGGRNNAMESITRS